MAIGFGGWVRVGLAGAPALLAITGCGEAFTATGGGTTTSTSAGGGGASTTGGGGSTSTGGTTGGTGGSGGTTVMPDCMPGATQPCFTVYAEKRKQGICKAAATGDYHELLARKDVDAAVIGAPDHWHVPLSIDACAAGKDVYVEKPLTHDLTEGA